MYKSGPVIKSIENLFHISALFSVSTSNLIVWLDPTAHFESGEGSVGKTFAKTFVERRASKRFRQKYNMVGV